MSDKIRQQFDILHQRTWNYNDLLWKNFLAYGAVLSSIAYLCLKELAQTFVAQEIVATAGAGVLFFLAIIQINLLRGHRKSVERLADFEKTNGYESLTATPTLSSLFGSYALASAAMLGFADFMLWHGTARWGHLLSATILRMLVGVLSFFFMARLIIRTKRLERWSERFAWLKCVP